MKSGPNYPIWGTAHLMRFCCWAWFSKVFLFVWYAFVIFSFIFVGASKILFHLPNFLFHLPKFSFIFQIFSFIFQNSLSSSKFSLSSSWPLPKFHSTCNFHFLQVFSFLLDLAVLSCTLFIFYEFSLSACHISLWQIQFLYPGYTFLLFVSGFIVFRFLQKAWCRLHLRFFFSPALPCRLECNITDGHRH